MGCGVLRCVQWGAILLSEWLEWHSEGMDWTVRLRGEHCHRREASLQLLRLGRPEALEARSPESHADRPSLLPHRCRRRLQRQPAYGRGRIHCRGERPVGCCDLGCRCLEHRLHPPEGLENRSRGARVLLRPPASGRDEPGWDTMGLNGLRIRAGSGGCDVNGVLRNGDIMLTEPRGPLLAWFCARTGQPLQGWENASIIARVSGLLPVVVILYNQFHRPDIWMHVAA